jgi:hypothetical protein
MVSKTNLNKNTIIDRNLLTSFLVAKKHAEHDELYSKSQKKETRMIYLKLLEILVIHCCYTEKNGNQKLETNYSKNFSNEA